jgi:hypothetical protein
MFRWLFGYDLSDTLVLVDKRGAGKFTFLVSSSKEQLLKSSLLPPPPGSFIFSLLYFSSFAHLKVLSWTDDLLWRLKFFFAPKQTKSKILIVLFRV